MRVPVEIFLYELSTVCGITKLDFGRKRLRGRGRSLTRPGGEYLFVGVGGHLMGRELITRRRRLRSQVRRVRAHWRLFVPDYRQDESPWSTFRRLAYLLCFASAVHGPFDGGCLLPLYILCGIVKISLIENVCCGSDGSSVQVGNLLKRASVRWSTPWACGGTVSARPIAGPVLTSRVGR